MGNKFSIDDASGRSKCKVSNKLIKKDELRIGILVCSLELVN